MTLREREREEEREIYKMHGEKIDDSEVNVLGREAGDAG
jgi:hypothetical protein